MAKARGLHEPYGMRARRYGLLVLLSLVTLNAVGGGIYGLSGAKSLPVA